MTTKEWFNQASAEEAASAFVNMVKSWLFIMGLKDTISAKHILALWDAFREYWNHEYNQKEIEAAERNSKACLALLDLMRSQDAVDSV